MPIANTEKLKEPSIPTIRLYDFRHYFCTKKLNDIGNPYQVMVYMGHKKLDTTQHYLSAMTAQQATEQEYISKAVQLGTPNTIKEIMELVEAGFKKETEADGYQIFRKPK